MDPLQVSTAAAMPDSHVDTAAATRSPVGDDQDTCRICRTEGSAEEPLFHPCKCSGSIGYVHQECLMEWLSHSQKKHCELCKTSFRFTKLYDPNMPQALPTWIFLQRASLHILTAAITWLRALLVFATWFIWLPWSMRFVWWGLFWIADGGFSTPSTYNATLTVHLSHQNQTTYSLNHNADPHATSSATSFLGYLLPWPKRLAVSEATSNHSIPSFNQTSTSSTVHDRHSLLSGISLLRSLTPSSSVNAFITDILEGGIIALSVVATFILIFLIREWVVQQQPQVNLAAADDIDLARRIDAAAAERAVEAPPQPDGDGTAANNDDIDDHVAPSSQNGDSDSVTSRPSDPQQTLNDVLKELTQLFEVIQTIDSTAMESDDLRNNILHRLENNLQMSIRAYNSLLDIRGVSADHDFNEKAVSVLQSIISQLPDGSRPELEHQLDMLVQRLRLSALQRLASSDEGPSAAAVSDPDDAAESSSSRPAMPDRALSSLGTDVQRELQESSPTSRSRADLPQIRTQSAANDDNESWDTLDSDDESLQQTQLTPPSASATTDDATADESANGNARNGGTASESSEAVSAPLNARGIKPQGSIMDRLLVWLWDEQPTIYDSSNREQDDEHIVEDLEAEAPFVPVADARANRQEQPAPQAQNGGIVGQDPEVVAAAAQAGINPNEQDIQDDVEDLEGLMELIGMQGPLIGLFQNAIFTAVVISATVSLAVWFPYLWGKVVLLMIAYPLYALILPYRFLEGAIAFCMDTGIWLIAGTVAWVDSVFRVLLSIGSSALPLLERFSKIDHIGRFANKQAASALTRLSDMVASSADTELAEYVHFSLSSHVALRRIQSIVKTILLFSATSLYSIFQKAAAFDWSPSSLLSALDQTTRELWSNVYHLAGGIYGVVSSWSWTVNVEKTVPASSLDQSLAQWNTADRSIAIFVGYAFFAVAGAIYLARLAPVTSSPRSRKIEDVIMEILQQAGGVLKVILIISIEMLAFPLYCGFLLDFAMLPLFGNASFASRIAFTMTSPWASAFIHWFIGTCYMFHFALFVSMCRKIMRKGVLYFIRDPDDPTFHPIRDVLDRSVTSQLRKIAFSALIYGGLVIVCLGSIVWLLAGGISGILPIKWMPVKGYLGFPLDLLLYSLLKPFAVRYLTPSNSLHSIYEWWFRRCARQLRLSNFMFGDHRDDELKWADSSEKTATKALADGRFVRAPASDQVRVPRGQRVFLEVNEDNIRIDGQPESNDPSAVHGKRNENFVKVYVPSWFRLRIAAFIFCLWLLTAAVGTGLTVVPLMVGRLLFSLVLPDELWASDIYAFSVGMGLGSAAIYGFLNREKIAEWSKTQARMTGQHLRNFSSMAISLAKRTASVAYVYGVLAIFGPALLSLLAEFYLIGPIHAYLAAGGSSTATDAVSKAANSVHVVRLAQDWTLGVQYLRVVMQIVSWTPHSRMSRALNRVVANGWLHPDVALATRGFILPSVVLFAAAMLTPAVFAQITIHLLSRDKLFDVHIMRLAYPALLLVLFGLWICSELLGALTRWKSRIRDEVYLIGERLHNFGDPAAGPRPASASVSSGRTG